MWSDGWTPLATLRGKGVNTSLYYIEVDHLDAPTHIRNEFNQIVWSWNNREAFGYIAPNEDVDGNGTYFEFNVRFPGQWFDKETALFHNGFRDYNPSTGRYMQSDPLGLDAGFNTYAYVGNNPYRAVDPYGLKVNFTGDTPMETKNLLRRSSQKSPLLFNALRTLHLSKTEYTIHTVKSGGSSYNYSTKTIVWNNNRINSCIDFSEIADTSKVNRMMYPAEALYHEVSHAYLNEMELTEFNSLWNFKEESNALYFENRIRSELGYPDAGRNIFEYYMGWK